MADQIECSLLVFYATTTEKQQLEIATKKMGFQFARKSHPQLGRYYEIGEVGDFHLIAVRTEMGPLTFGGSASKGIFFKLGTPATAIVQLGMAFGIDPNRQKCGDVLVSTSLIPYDRRKAISHEGHYRFDYEAATQQLAKQSMIELFIKAATKGGLPFGVHTGAILSGGTAIYSSRYRDELVGCFPHMATEIVGGEMEGVGLLSVSPPDDPAWIVVKGVSDFAEDERSAEFQQMRELACRNSATFVLTALLNEKQP